MTIQIEANTATEPMASMPTKRSIDVGELFRHLLAETESQPEFEPKNLRLVDSHVHIEGILLLDDLIALVDHMDIKMPEGYWSDMELERKVQTEEPNWMTFMKNLTTPVFKDVMLQGIIQGKAPNDILTSFYQAGLTKLYNQDIRHLGLRFSPYNLIQEGDLARKETDIHHNPSRAQITQAFYDDTGEVRNEYKGKLLTLEQYLSTVDTLIRSDESICSAREVPKGDQMQVVRLFCLRRDKKVDFGRYSNQKICDENRFTHLVEYQKKGFLDFLDIAGNEAARALSEFSQLLDYTQKRNLCVILHGGELPEEKSELAYNNLELILSYSHILAIGHVVRAFDLNERANNILRSIVEKNLFMEILFHSNYFLQIVKSDEVHPLLAAMLGFIPGLANEPEVLRTCRERIIIASDDPSIGTNLMREIEEITETFLGEAGIQHLLFGGETYQIKGESVPKEVAETLITNTIKRLLLYKFVRQAQMHPMFTHYLDVGGKQAYRELLGIPN